jgi:hypothetical protein
MHYPVLEYPAKVNSLSLDKTHFQGKLTGIKGQYLLLKMEAFSIFRVQRYVVTIKV